MSENILPELPYFLKAIFKLMFFYNSKGNPHWKHSKLDSLEIAILNKGPVFFNLSTKEWSNPLFIIQTLRDKGHDIWLSSDC